MDSVARDTLYIKGLLEKIYLLNRTICSEEIKQALEILRKETGLDLHIHLFPSGKECLTWIIPPTWRLKEGYISNGRHKIVDSRHHPLYVAAYSKSYDGYVTQEELRRHIVTEKDRPNAIPFFVDWELEYRERDWAFCVPYLVAKQLTENKYYVKIESEFVNDSLSLGEVYLPGRKKDEILFISNICHPGQMNDAITGVGVGMDVFRKIRQWKDQCYSYRLLTVPEYIGSAAYLSERLSELKNTKYAIFIKVLGNNAPFALQKSFDGDTRVDRVAHKVLADRGTPFTWDAFRNIIGNDEIFFEGPSVRIPCVSISRSEVRNLTGRARTLFDQYHSSADEPAIVFEERLQEASSLILEILSVFERDRVVVPRYVGAPHMYRYNLWFDFDRYPKLNTKMHRLLISIDGNKSIFDLAHENDMEFWGTVELMQRMEDVELVRLDERNEI